jgi:hypothetical protein
MSSIGVKEDLRIATGVGRDLDDVLIPAAVAAAPQSSSSAHVGGVCVLLLVLGAVGGFGRQCSAWLFRGAAISIGRGMEEG